MKITYYLILLSSLTFISSCTNNSQSINREQPGSLANDTSSNHHWQSGKDFTPLSFLEAVKNKDDKKAPLNFVTIEDSFPPNWLRKKDIDTLIKLINSKGSCKCFVSPLFSYLPSGDGADIGGYAIELIKAYSQNRIVSFGLYSCPKTKQNETEEIIKWWNEHKND